MKNLGKDAYRDYFYWTVEPGNFAETAGIFVKSLPFFYK